MSKASPEYLTLLDYVRSLPEGAAVLYDQVQFDTGVSMDKTNGNRHKLGRAIERSHRTYLPCYVDGRCIGFDMDRANLAIPIQARQGRRILGVTRKASRRSRLMVEKHAAELSPELRQRLVMGNRVLSFMEEVTTRRVTRIQVMESIPPPDPKARELK